MCMWWHWGACSLLLWHTLCSPGRLMDDWFDPSWCSFHLLLLLWSQVPLWWSHATSESIIYHMKVTSVLWLQLYRPQICRCWAEPETSGCVIFAACYCKATWKNECKQRDTWPQYRVFLSALRCLLDLRTCLCSPCCWLFNKKQRFLDHLSLSDGFSRSLFSPCATHPLLAQLWPLQCKQKINKIAHCFYKLYPNM